MAHQGEQVEMGVPGLYRILGDYELELRYDTRGKRIEWQQVLDGAVADPLKWEPVNDRWEAKLREDMGRDYNNELGKPWRPSKPRWEDILKAYVSTREEDSFLAWVETLEWDEEDRIEELIPRLMDVEEEHLNMARWAGRYLLAGSVVRALVPGHKLDNMPVFIGEQGSAKSTFCAHLFPKEKRMDWFGDGLELDQTNKEKAEALEGRVIVEVAEMGGMRRADREKLKAFLTRQNDGQHRGAYKKHREDSLRRVCLVGTANNDGGGVLPHDPSGQRRYGPIEVSGDYGQTVEYLAEFREQLWAEAYHKALKNIDEAHQGVYHPWASPILHTLEETIEQDMSTSRWEQQDAAILDKLHEVVKPATLNDIGIEIGMIRHDEILDLGAQRRLGSALRAEGFEKKQVTDLQTKRRVMKWYPPEYQESYAKGGNDGTKNAGDIGVGSPSGGAAQERIEGVVEGGSSTDGPF